MSDLFTDDTIVKAHRQRLRVLRMHLQPQAQV